MSIQTNNKQKPPRLHLPFFFFQFSLHIQTFTDRAELFLVFSTLSSLKFIHLSLPLPACRPLMGLIPVLGLGKPQDGCRGIHAGWRWRGEARMPGGWWIREGIGGPANRGNRGYDIFEFGV